jgi:hypothetical protein
MKTRPAPPALTFGEFILAAYQVWGKRRASGYVWLAVKSHLVKFRGQNRFEFSERWLG